MSDVYVVSEWLRYARMDYDAAMHLRSFHPMPIEIICYHCQQAAEKALKAVLIHHGKEVPHIHDTQRLWKFAAALEPTLSPFMPQSSRLANFATITRYPKELELNENDMQRTLDDARAIVEAIETLYLAAGDSENSTIKFRGVLCPPEPPTHSL